MRVSNSGKTSVVVKLLKRSKVTINLKVSKFNSQLSVFGVSCVSLRMKFIFPGGHSMKQSHEGAVCKFRNS